MPCVVVASPTSRAEVPSRASPVLAGSRAQDVLDLVLWLHERRQELLVGLVLVRHDLERARAYAARPDGNPILAAARIAQLRARRSPLRALLRADRIVARAVLAEILPTA